MISSSCSVASSRARACWCANKAFSYCHRRIGYKIARSSQPPEADFLSAAGVFPADSLRVIPHFVTQAEESSLVAECSKYVDRLPYQSGHWDGVIVGYRETEKSRWNAQNEEIVQRIRKEAFGEQVQIRPSVHVLDMSSEGYIKPHVDAVKFCGEVIAGLSLLSSCVMRFTHEKNPELTVDALLPPRSLYIMRGDARYLYTHEILKDQESFFMGCRVRRGRRISFICREPVPRIVPEDWRSLSGGAS